MITRNDLYDMTYVLVIIRNDIKNKVNTEVLSQLVRVLETRDDIGENQIRRALSSVVGLDRERWYFVYHENVYVQHYLLQNEDIYCLLITLLKNLLTVIKEENFEKAYDLVDSFHCLPEVIADNHFAIPKSFWKIYVKDYRNKWDKNFLRSY